jgi:hypothetical protein
MGVSVFPAAGGGVSLQQAIFTSSGTFTLPSGYGAGKPLIVDLEIVGGGGGGGSGVANTANCYGGGGGGSGITVVYKSIPLTANATITIGAGGAGGAAVASANNGINGNSGGTTDVNSIYYAPGGGFGSRGTITATDAYGGYINSHGFNVLGGYAPSSVAGVGGAGGSGGGYSLSIGTNPAGLETYRGGARGLPGGAYQGQDSTGIVQTQRENGAGVYSQTLNQVGNAIYPFANDSNQRGAGGGGGRAATTTNSGRGGKAGTRFTGGLNGWNNGGSPTGETATDSGCGGGGGGASFNNGNSGAGGAGASGLVVVTYWA